MAVGYPSHANPRNEALTFTCPQTRPQSTSFTMMTALGRSIEGSSVNQGNQLDEEIPPEELVDPTMLCNPST